ncbi:hypothetical protein [Actinomadura oligospora]|uniref:beta-xylosidase family glycoside hydrolase n=1 Tax=Actinomadura oligospora TaxID=111804 RepID=UPI003CCC31E6
MGTAGRSDRRRLPDQPGRGRFTGVLVGLYATSNGRPSTNHADFDWFEYVPL